MIKLEFTVEQVNLILGSLAKLPFEVSSELIFNIRSQATPQVQQQQEEVKQLPQAAE